MCRLKTHKGRYLPVRANLKIQVCAERCVQGTEPPIPIPAAIPDLPRIGDGGPIPDLPGIGGPSPPPLASPICRGSGIIPIPGSHRGFRALGAFVRQIERKLIKRDAALRGLSNEYWGCSGAT
jgi:hypothetical protein